MIKDISRVAGKSLKELNLRVETGATIIAIQRGDTIHHNPPSNFILKEKDIIVFIGKREEVERAIAFIEK